MVDNEKHYLPKVLRKRGCYQNGNSHFCTIKRYDCLVGDQNDHQLKSVRYGWVASGQFVHLFAVPGLGVDDLAALFALDSAYTGVTVNEIFHQSILIFAFPLFRCHRHPPLVLWVYGGYQNGNSHFRTIKRCDCLVDGQNDHQPESVRYS